ncbi:sugar phosphate isomerase/epimerase (plasmid) [Deinococcus sp. KNUC1210]|uniref:sugar phosphate isomerase/epimerase family protein n=1 Tax=Deinococcus sp. KNUC1210 TaxID=2917691 RepID=UPI001EF14A04|nr:sugar phosphate isomerase/epimerase family protein [Deinococcus sp. KNUC1210]ULH17908.1 sugar phosphate isomerase/epimerase [Deinococcus sp. KNUC1210]
MLYATRLNSLKSRPELAFSPGPISTRHLLERAARITGLNSLSLNFPEHFSLETLKETRQQIEDLGLSVDSLNIRYPADTFGDGGFTHPSAAVRQAAIDLSCQALDACAALGGNHVIVWPGFDGFDYPFQDSYERMFGHTVEGFAQVAAHNPQMRVGIEYKPWEPRKYSLVGNMGEALLVVQEIAADNLGVVLDYCHAQMANEHAPKAAALALRHDKLFGVHLNDGYGRQDDGLMVGTTSLITTLELLVLLERGGYPGTLYFDTFPVREDPVRECEWNIRVSERLLTLARELAADPTLGSGHDAFNVTRVIERLLSMEPAYA